MAMQTGTKQRPTRRVTDEYEPSDQPHRLEAVWAARWRAPDMSPAAQRARDARRRLVVAFGYSGAGQDGELLGVDDWLYHDADFGPA